MNISRYSRYSDLLLQLKFKADRGKEEDKALEVVLKSATFWSFVNSSDPTQCLFKFQLVALILYTLGCGTPASLSNLYSSLAILQNAVEPTQESMATHQILIVDLRTLVLSLLTKIMLEETDLGYDAEDIKVDFHEPLNRGINSIYSESDYEEFDSLLIRQYDMLVQLVGRDSNWRERELYECFKKDMLSLLEPYVKELAGLQNGESKKATHQRVKFDEPTTHIAPINQEKVTRTVTPVRLPKLVDYPMTGAKNNLPDLNMPAGSPLANLSIPLHDNNKKRPSSLAKQYRVEQPKAVKREIIAKPKGQRIHISAFSDREMDPMTKRKAIVSFIDRVKPVTVIPPWMVDRKVTINCLTGGMRPAFPSFGK